VPQLLGNYIPNQAMILALDGIEVAYDFGREE